MKFKLQGIDTDLEIELKRSKRYYDWSNEGKPDYLKTDIVFCNDPDACPVGTVEWITQELRTPLFPVLLPTDLDYKYVGREIGQFSGTLVPDRKYYNEQIDTTRTYRAAHIDKFMFEGHRYIMFSGETGNQGYAGVVHDPDCPCFYKRDSI